MNKIILYHHLGLGDHFTCCGLVNEISERYDKIYLPCKKRNYETIKCLYSENPKVQLLEILYDEFNEVNNYAINLNTPVKMIGFISLSQKNYHMKFYEMAEIDFDKRYSKFNIPKIIEGSDELYKNVVGEYKEYILVHDSSSEEEQYKMDLFGWRNGDNSDLPIIRITDKITNNLLQWIDVIKKAKEIHVSPSSVFFLVDSIQLDINVDLYYHNIRPVGYEFLANTEFNDYKWNIVEYRD